MLGNCAFSPEGEEAVATGGCVAPIAAAMRAHPGDAAVQEEACDALLNLVLDETREYLKDPDDPYRLLDETRSLGLTVCRGTAVTLVCPADGFEEIANPFLQEGGDDEEPPEQ